METVKAKDGNISPGTPQTRQVYNGMAYSRDETMDL